MKRKLVSILTALALCLSLLPGTALALDETPTGVTFAYQGTTVTLTDGKFYVAAEGNNGITEMDAAPESGAYLAYTDGTLTVHGAFVTTAVVTVNSNLTITGGADSSLTVTAPYASTINLGNNSVLTLDGSVDFTANDNSRPVIQYVNFSSTGTFGAADSYSGGIVLRSGSAPAINGVPLDVQNSGSITITGAINSSKPAVLKSEGKVEITSQITHSSLELSIKGANVTLINNNNSGSPVFSGLSLNIEATGDVLITNKDGKSTAPALTGTAVISAGGDVEISSKGIPAAAPYSTDATYDLTVKNAKNVTITGSSGMYDAFFSVPVTFEKCGSVTVTDSGSGDLMKAGVTVSSDKPWTATTGEKAVTLPSGEWYYGGDTTEPKNQHVLSLSSTSSVPTCWKAGEGWIYYEPAADGSSPNKLTLDNATYGGKIGASNTNDLTVTAKGSNQIREIASTGRDSGSVAVKTEGGGTLNTVVSQMNIANKKLSTTVYGKVELTTGYALGPDVGNFETSMTIAPGAEATIPNNASLSIFDTTYLTNNGTIVNNGTVTLKDTAAANVTSETIKSLGLTGTGSVNVVTTGADGSTATDTYTNSGTKFLTPAGADGALDLSADADGDADHWEAQGYKWEVLETDPDNTSTITKAKLTLAPGFNATSVTLPDAAVTIVTEGESRIGTLSAGASPNSAKLTFSGTGPLTIQERLELSGGNGNSLTIEENAHVIALKGVAGGASGADFPVTVNGILTATGDSVSALYVGQVAIGNSGILEVFGESGVLLQGMPKNSGARFNSVFTIAGEGRFTSHCTGCSIQVNSSNETDYPKDSSGNPDASKVIVLGDEYMPDNCEVRLVDNDIKLWDTKNNKELTGPLTIHKNHTWETTWTYDETTHWHACEFAGCTEKQPGSEAPHYYAHGATACRDCHYPRPDGTPDSDSGSSGGSGGGSSSYAVTVEKASHGEVTSDRRTASQGDTVTLTVTPDNGYGLSALTVTDSRGNAIALTHEGGGTYRFTMPGRAVTVRAAFASSACTGGADCPSRAFSDLDTSKWYHEAVDYVLKNGLMSGYGSGLFGPDENLTRAQFTQILHNKEGKPVVNYLLQYSDVADGAWYTEAIRWATSQGVVNGYGNGRFGPNDNITREQLAVMLWRYAGSPAAAGEALHFTDADQAGGYALDALRWAVEEGILNGKGGGILDPKGLATRAQATQMLKNFLRDA